jgi:uncharacterized protein YgbK (DUF1537 family)
MHRKADDVLKNLPPESASELLPSIREEFLQEETTVVVFDDDPTGTQTCHDVVVLTSWDVSLIEEELRKKPSILFILTNSRSISVQEAVRLNLEIGKNLNEAAKKTGRKTVAISRSDSTLRGHFPAEVDALAVALGVEKAVRILIPAFLEGHRYTIDDVHYIVEKDELVPVSETPFAKDKVFGYRHSNLKEWVEEKTEGKIKSSDVESISLTDIRVGGPDEVAKKLRDCKEGQVCIVNACSYRDLEVFTMGLLLAEKSGKQFLYRSSATCVSIRAGIAPGKIFSPAKNEIDNRKGALIVVGSHVPKTTSQLNHVLKQNKYQSIEIHVLKLLGTSDTSSSSSTIAKRADEWLEKGEDVVIYTSRKLEIGRDAESNLKINKTVSSFLVDVVKKIKARPSFIMAKGGITSSDIASKGLSSQRALVLGQAIPGVPVWRLDAKSKFPEMIYIVFPGNVGDHSALDEVCRKIKSSDL